MGKVPYYPDSETDASSSAEITKKKKKFSILKYTKRSDKKKCKAHSLPEMEEPEYPTQNKKLRGILKHDITRDLPVVRKMSSQQRRDMMNRLSVAQETSSIAQEYIAQFLLNKELCSSETQIPEWQEPKCEIIYDNKPVPGTFLDSSSVASERSEASQGSFILGDQESIPDFINSEDRREDDVENIEKCLMIGLVIGRALTCMSKERRNKCLRKLSNFFKLDNYEPFTDYRNSDLFSASDEDLTDIDIPLDNVYPVGKCLVGRVPRPPGARPGHCGGVAIIVRKNPQQRSQGALRAQASISGSRARESMMKRLTHKKSY